MPHARNRWLAPLIQSNLKWSPAVGLYGLRQVGKSTLAQHLILDNKGFYESFDNETSLESARLAPAEFCNRNRLFCIDEVQKAPWLFPAIKNSIGTRRKPGRFLLTGSVRFTLKKEVRESLTGRIILHELLPFNTAEALQTTPATFLADLMPFAAKQETTHNDLEDFSKFKMAERKRLSLKQIQHHMTTGGLPISCFTRDAAKRNQWFQGYFETLLVRDLALVDSALSRVTFRQGISFLRQLSLAQGQTENLSQMAQQSALTANQAAKFLAALEALSLIDRIPPEFHAKKSARKMRIEWKDIGLWNYLAGIGAHLLTHDTVATGLSLSQEFRTQIGLMDKPYLWSYYRSRDNASIPWVFRRSSQALALTNVQSESPSPLDYRALADFVSREKYALGVVLGPSQSTPTLLGKKIWFLPFTWAY